jgi:hypothetical protein
MVRHLCRLRGLPAFLAVCAAVGCAGAPARPKSPIGPPASRDQANARGAQEPAAPLQIPGPAPQASAPPSPVSPNELPSPAPRAAPPAPTPERGIPVARSQTPPAQADASAPLRELYRLAQQRYATVDGYVVRLKRREQVGGKLGSEEVIQLKFRKEPWGVYLRWIGETAKGREVVYVKGRHGNQIHTLTCAADSPLGSLGAGKHVQLAPDNPLVTSRSRYTITDTGVGALIDRYGQILESCERGENRLGTLKHLGPLKRQEFEDPVEAVLQFIPAGVEPGLPRGGQRFWYFDTTGLRFPVLIQTVDERGGLVEYYCYDNFLFPGRFSDDEFDPDRLWNR